MPPRRKKPLRQLTSNPVVETSDEWDSINNRRVCYRRELVQCGKANCLKWHGPYWYAYWSERNRTRKLYIGKELLAASVVYEANAARRKAR